MLRTLLIMALLSATLSGCLSENASGVEDPPDIEDATRPDPPTSGDGPSGTSGAPGSDDADTSSHKEFSGRGKLTEVAVCPPALGCWGHWSWDYEGAAKENAITIVNVTWDARAPDLEAVEIFIYEGSDGLSPGDPIIARAEGKSPITIALDGDDLKGHSGPFGVAFHDKSIVSVQWEQEFYWNAVVFDS